MASENNLEDIEQAFTLPFFSSLNIEDSKIKDVCKLHSAQLRLIQFSSVALAVEVLKKEGNALYETGQFENANVKYQKGIKILEEYPVSNESDEDAREIQIFTFYVNLAQSLIRLEKYRKACIAAQSALQIHITNKKTRLRAFYKLGVAKYELGSNDQAEDICKKSLIIEPTNLKFKMLLDKVENAMKNKTKQ